MTKIPKTPSTPSIQPSSFEADRRSNATQHSTPKRTSAASKTELQRRLNSMIKEGSLPTAELKEEIIKNIVQWQFGDAIATEQRYASAYLKLKANVAESPEYQALINQFIDEEKA